MLHTFFVCRNHELKFFLLKVENTPEGITEMTQRPTNVTTTNNTRSNNLVTMSPLDLKPQHIKDIEQFNEGQKCITNFAVDFILRDEDGSIVYRCGECNSQTFRYKDMYSDDTDEQERV